MTEELRAKINPKSAGAHDSETRTLGYRADLQPGRCFVEGQVVDERFRILRLVLLQTH